MLEEAKEVFLVSFADDLTEIAAEIASEIAKYPLLPQAYHYMMKGTFVDRIVLRICAYHFITDI